MTFFNAYKAVGADVRVPTYFIESTAPNNVDDTGRISIDPLPHLQLIGDSDDAVRQIAGDLVKGDSPNLVVMVHGFNNPQAEVLKTYTAAALAVNGDEAIRDRQGVVCLGYRCVTCGPVGVLRPKNQQKSRVAATLRSSKGTSVRSRCGGCGGRH